MKTRVVSGEELHKIVHAILLEAVTTRDPQGFMAAIVIGGDRIACCDEAIVCDDDSHRGIATIAPEGEYGGTGMPTIVGVFVREADRRCGYGAELFAAAVRRCIERGFERVHVDVLSEGMRYLIEGLPADLRAVLEVEEYSVML